MKNNHSLNAEEILELSDAQLEVASGGYVDWGDVAYAGLHGGLTGAGVGALAGLARLHPVFLVGTTVVGISVGAYQETVRQLDERTLETQ